MKVIDCNLKFIYLYLIEEPKSAFQIHQERVNKQIKQLEMENVAEKDWTLIGEVSMKF